MTFKLITRPATCIILGTHPPSQVGGQGSFVGCLSHCSSQQEKLECLLTGFQGYHSTRPSPCIRQGTGSNIHWSLPCAKSIGLYVTLGCDQPKAPTGFVLQMLLGSCLDTQTWSCPSALRGAILPNHQEIFTCGGEVRG